VKADKAEQEDVQAAEDADEQVFCHFTLLYISVNHHTFLEVLCKMCSSFLHPPSLSFQNPLQASEGESFVILCHCDRITVFFMNMMVHFFVGGFLGVFCMLLFLKHAKGEAAFSDASLLKAVLKTPTLVVMISGFLFGGLFSLNAFLFPELFFFFDLLTIFLVFSALYDFLFRLLPLPLLLSMMAFLVVASLFFSTLIPFQEALLGGGVVGGVVLLLYLISKGRGIGEADILYAFILGFLFGWEQGLIVFSAANFLGLLVILPLLGWLGKERMKEVPLVLFIVVAVFLEFYFDYSESLLHWLQLS